jgi:hypothetical protein
MTANRENHGIAVLTQDTFLSFVAAPGALVYAAPGAKPELLHSFMQGALAFSIPPVTVGVIDVSTVQWTAIRKTVATTWLRPHGLSLNVLEMPPTGYYLFSGGSLLGFHPGDFDLEQDSGSLKVAAATALFGFLMRSAEVVQFGAGILGMPAAGRVVAWVKERLEGAGRGAASGAAAPEQDDVLRRAYAALGLTPGASDDEVKAAHRGLVKKHHPDQFPHDSELQRAATMRTAELNAARDLILDRHAKRRRAS